jgi:hypothetical protein
MLCMWTPFHRAERLQMQSEARIGQPITSGIRPCDQDSENTILQQRLLPQRWQRRESSLIRGGDQGRLVFGHQSLVYILRGSIKESYMASRTTHTQSEIHSVNHDIGEDAHAGYQVTEIAMKKAMKKLDTSQPRPRRPARGKCPRSRRQAGQ